MVSGYVNLPEQKKVFTQERSSILSGWDTYMEGVMSCENGLSPGAPLTYFNDGRGPKDFSGSDILARRDFFGSMKDAGIFLDCEKNTGIFLGIVFFISSNQQ